MSKKCCTFARILCLYANKSTDMKHLKYVCATLLIATVLCGCKHDEQAPEEDVRTAFIGDYTFVSSGAIDLYWESTKMATVPMDKEGELSIVAGEASNEVWVVAEGDSAQAYIAGDELLMKPMQTETTIASMELDMAFTYGTAKLVNNQLSMTAYVDINATYKSAHFAGNGQVDVVATKKDKK